jgi:hypothetical protein
MRAHVDALSLRLTRSCSMLTRAFPRARFARVGPSPHFPPAGGYHSAHAQPASHRASLSPCPCCSDARLYTAVFDGDGMVFAVRIKADGSATFTNAWVRTLRFHIENAAQGPVVPKMGDMHGLGGVALMALQGAKMCVV